MNQSPIPQEPSRLTRVTLALNPWLQIFLTIIAGVVVAVIAWLVIERFLHILILLIASSLLAYLLGPLVDRLEGGGRLPRVWSILSVYLIFLGAMGVGLALLAGPLTRQLQALTDALPGIVDTRSGFAVGLDQFFQQHGIAFSVVELRNKLIEYITSAGSQLLGGTLAFVAGLVSFVTDLLLILAITFYLLLDGHSMHNRALRLLPATGRERWFFVEATLNRVLGGYIRGQLIVAVTVGLAAGIGSFLLGVHYPLVIGLLAFLFEFIPMLGPVLGMIPAVIIAFFQSPTLALWTALYFIVLQQVESNVIVPRVSGHAVGLHPLAALLALLAGFEIGGLGGALLAVPLAGVLYVIALAIYSDVAGHTDLLVAAPKRTAYGTAYNSLRRVFVTRRGRRVGANGASYSAPGSVAAGTNGSTNPTQAASQSPHTGKHETASMSVASVTTQETSGSSPQAASGLNDRLASIAHDQAQLIARFEAGEKEQANFEEPAEPGITAATEVEAGEVEAESNPIRTTDPT